MPTTPRQLFYALALAACLAAAPAMAQTAPAQADAKSGMSAQEILQKAISQALDNIRAQNPKALGDDTTAGTATPAAGDDEASIPTPTMGAKPPVAPVSPLNDLLAPPSINAPAPPVMVAPAPASGQRPRTIVLPDAQGIAGQEAEQTKIPPLPPIPDCDHGQVLSSHNGHLICVTVDQPPATQPAAPSTPQQDCPAASLSVFIGGESIHLHFEVPYTPDNGQSRADRRKFQITAVCHNGLYSLVSVVRKECGGQVCMPGMIPADSVTFYCKPTITTTCYAKRDDGRLNPNLGITARLENQF